MQKNFKLVLDTHCEVYDQLKPWMDDLFWKFEEHINDGKLLPGAVYIIGRHQFNLFSEKIIQLVNDNIIKVIYSSPSEGSETIVNHCQRCGILDLIKQKKILMISGGDVPEELAALCYENFLPKVLDYDENLQAIQEYQEQYSSIRPYKFLFLNGRCRLHRMYLLNRLKPLLDNNYAIWSNLDIKSGPIKLLDDHHELDRINKNINTNRDNYVKEQLFRNHGGWGEIYLKANIYNSTYFSLVTETICGYPYSFRTEKIWKPVAIGHPWIAATNLGFYRDIRNLGFQTFNHVIDESFDLIDNWEDRLKRISTIVEDLCQQDLAKFLEECYTVCKYNQQHLAELRPKIRQELPDRFFNFLKQCNFHE